MYRLKQILKKMEKLTLEHDASFQYSIFFNDGTYEFCESWDFEDKFDFSVLLLSADFKHMYWSVGKRYKVERVDDKFTITEIEG